jgi:hypothetical protein
MKKLGTATLLATLVAASPALTGSGPVSASPAQPVGVRLPASGHTEQEMIFLRDGRTIRAEKTERLGDRIRVETPTGRIELPASRVLSIHPMDSRSGSPSSPPPAEVYRGLTQQLTDRVRGQIQEQSSPSHLE